jgi:ABC-type Zn2+ transport system substrate-binding protein/surface adhesin
MYINGTVLILNVISSHDFFPAKDCVQLNQYKLKDEIGKVPSHNTHSQTDYTRAHMRARTHTRTHTHAHTHTRTHTHAHKHTHTLTNTHTLTS